SPPSRRPPRSAQAAAVVMSVRCQRSDIGDRGAPTASVSRLGSQGAAARKIVSAGHNSWGSVALLDHRALEKPTFFGTDIGFKSPSSHFSSFAPPRRPPRPQSIPDPRNPGHLYLGQRRTSLLCVDTAPRA